MSANLGTSAVRLYTLSLDFAEPCIMLHANAVCIKAGARLCKAFLFLSLLDVHWAGEDLLNMLKVPFN